MNFSGTVDPDDPAPTNENNGTFNSIGDLVQAAPNGARVAVRLEPGKVHEITADVVTENRSLYVYRRDYWARPNDPPAIIKPTVYVSGGANRLAQIKNLTGSILLSQVDIDLSGAKEHAWLPFSTTGGSLFGFSHGGVRNIGLWGCNVSGPASLDNGDHARNLVTGIGAQIVTLAISACSFSGNVTALGHANASVAVVSHNDTTLQGGAALVDDTDASAGRLLMN